MKIRFTMLLLALVLTVLASSPAFGVKSKGGALGSTGHHVAKHQGTDAMCDWYQITCNGGGGDLCCGDANSCLTYCENICGGPCVLVGGPED